MKMNVTAHGLDLPTLPAATSFLFIVLFTLLMNVDPLIVVYWCQIVEDKKMSGSQQMTMTYQPYPSLNLS